MPFLRPSKIGHITVPCPHTTILITINPTVNYCTLFVSNFIVIDCNCYMVTDLGEQLLLFSLIEIAVIRTECDFDRKNCTRYHVTATG